MTVYSTETISIRYLQDTNGFKAGDVISTLKIKADQLISEGKATTDLVLIDKTKEKVVVSDEVKEVVVLTQAEYDALPEKDDKIQYNIVG